MLLDELAVFCKAHGWELSPDQLRSFDHFRDDLYKVNLTTNLTRVQIDDCERRHFLDSLLVAPLIPYGAHVLDLGTGPGFPAWPLARVRPDLQLTALDSSGKMIRFLNRHPLQNLRTVQGRAEEILERAHFDVVTGRALAPLAIQLELSAAYCKIGGQVIPFRSLNERAILSSINADKLGLELSAIHEFDLPGSDVVRLFPVYTVRKLTPRKYPRSWSQIKACPIA